MNWSLIILLSLTFNLFNYANGLFFVLDPHEERCISRQMNEKETFGGAYFVSGEREEGNKAFIKSADGKIIWEVNGQKNSSFNFVVEKEGN